MQIEAKWKKKKSNLIYAADLRKIKKKNGGWKLPEEFEGNKERSTPLSLSVCLKKRGEEELSFTPIRTLYEDLCIYRSQRKEERENKKTRSPILLIYFLFLKNSSIIMKPL